jgi:hypothetical protein
MVVLIVVYRVCLNPCSTPVVIFVSITVVVCSLVICNKGSCDRIHIMPQSYVTGGPIETS